MVKKDTTTIDDLEAQLEQKDSQLADMDAKLELAKANLADADKKLAEYGGKLADADTKVQLLQGELDAANALLSEKGGQPAMVSGPGGTVTPLTRKDPNRSRFAVHPKDRIRFCTQGVKPLPKNALQAVPVEPAAPKQRIRFRG